MAAHVDLGPGPRGRRRRARPGDRQAAGRAGHDRRDVARAPRPGAPPVAAHHRELPARRRTPQRRRGGGALASIGVRDVEVDVRDDAAARAGRARRAAQAHRPAADRCARHRRHPGVRGRQRQGRGRQEHGDRQPRRGARRHRQAGRSARRRRVGLLDAPPVRRAAQPGRARRADAAGARPRRRPDVDRILRQRGPTRRLARTNAAQGVAAVRLRHLLGHARRAVRRPSARAPATPPYRCCSCSRTPRCSPSPPRRPPPGSWPPGWRGWPPRPASPSPGSSRTCPSAECAACGTQTAIFGTGGGARLAEECRRAAARQGPARPRAARGRRRAASPS